MFPGFIANVESEEIQLEFLKKILKQLLNELEEFFSFFFQQNNGGITVCS